MNHEPECTVVVGRYDTAPSCDECDRLRAAYQRGREDADRWCNVADIAYRKGREDAAEGIRNFYFGQRWPDYANPDDIVHQLIAAARGEGAE